MDLGVDVVLLVTASYGYAVDSASNDASYRPYVLATAHLFPAGGSKAVLMRETIVYNCYEDLKYPVIFPPDPRYKGAETLPPYPNKS